jgi:hypothetical protein
LSNWAGLQERPGEEKRNRGSEKSRIAAGQQKMARSSGRRGKGWEDWEKESENVEEEEEEAEKRELRPEEAPAEETQGGQTQDWRWHFDWDEGPGIGQKDGGRAGGRTAALLAN